MDSFPECQVCHDFFTLKGPTPYLLPCLHDVCETCVTSAVGRVISCSTCQREVNLTETHLQKDLVRQREIFHLTVQHRPSELLCTHEDDGNQAVCWCQECEDFLCEYCQNMHDSFKYTKKHVVQEIADIQPGSLDLDEYCSIHKSHPFDFWDKECNCLICGRCRRGDHAEHDVVDVDEAADVTRAEFETHEKEVKRICASHYSLHQTTQEQLRLADGTSDALKDKISHSFQSLKALLDQREKELIITQQQQIDQAKSQLDSKATVEQYELRCKLTTKYIKKALLYTSKYDLLKLKKMIGETTQICLHSPAAEEPENILLPVLRTEELAELKSTLSSFGAIVTLNNMSSHILLSQDTDDDNPQLETVKQAQKKHLEGLDDEVKKTQLKVMELQATVRDVTRHKDQLEEVNSTYKGRIKDIKWSVENYKMKVKKHEQTLKEIDTDDDNPQLETVKQAQKKHLEGLDDEVKKTHVKVTELQATVRDVTRHKDQLEEVNSTYKGRIKDLKWSVDNYKMKVKKHEQTLREIDLSPDITYHPLKNNILNMSSVLQCLHLKYDTEKVNLKYTHINGAGELVNKPGTRAGGDTSGRFQNYWGTTSTVPLSKTDSPLYTEVLTPIRIDRTLVKNLLVMNTGICRKADRDVDYQIADRQYCYSLEVAQCPKHKCICTNVSKDGYLVHHVRGTLPNTAGSHTTLHHGVVFDTTRNKIVFLDVKQMKVIWVLGNVDYTQPMWPVFAVYSDIPATVSMKLVVGNDIDMTPEKKAMILTAL